MKKNKLLVHVCCANCGAAVIEELNDQFEIILLWFNPNIQPREEYLKRLADFEKLAEIYCLPKIIKDDYLLDWQKSMRGLEDEPEGGKRCEVCFQFRINQTAQIAKDNQINWIATTLTIGPQKRAKVINQIGEEIAKELGLDFYLADFKKREGFKKSVELSKKYSFYRQNYCGCLYSKNS